MKLENRYRAVNPLAKAAAGAKYWFKCLNLKKKIIFIVALTFLIVFTLCFIIFSMAMAYTERQNHETSLNNTFAQKVNQTNEYFSKLDDIAYSIMFSNWAQELLRKNPTMSASEKQLIRNNSSHFLSSLSTVNDDIRFALISTDGETFQNNSFLRMNQGVQIQDEVWYEQFLKDGKYIEYGNSTLVYADLKEWSLSIYYPLTDNCDFHLAGYLVVSIPREKLHFLVENVVNEQGIIITDEKGDLITTNLSDGEAVLKGLPKSLEPGTFQDSNDNKILFDVMEQHHWKVWVIQPKGQNGSASGLGLIFLLMIPLGMFFLTIAIWFSSYLTTPIIHCKNAILAIRDNQLGIKLDNHYHDEIGELIDGFNDMSDAIVNLISQNKMIDLLKREAEFDMLQQKINPHFLYNTLEIINGLILNGKNERAVRVCETLGQMFRYNLNDKKWVRLRDEYEYIRQYLLIIQYKISDLVVSLDVDESLMDSTVLKFIIQPVVENSIKHGFRDKKMECCLTIRIKEHQDQIKIVVMDNGAGMEEEQKQMLDKALEQARRQQAVKDKTHIGVQNIYQRLFIEYGKRLGFTITSKKNMGTKTEIIIPKGESF